MHVGLKRLSALAGLIALLCATVAQADIVTFNMDTVLLGTAPGGSGPWVTAEMNGSGGTVTLTIINRLQLAEEYLNACLFIVDPAIPAGNLSVALVSGQSFVNWSGTNHITIGFPGPDRFVGGETSVYTITGNANLSASSFSYPLEWDGDIPLFAAASVGVLGQDKAMIIATGPSTRDPSPIPAPAAVALGLIGLGMVARLRRRAT